MTTTQQQAGSPTPFVTSPGVWTLDPAATTITLHTKALWGMAKVKATFTALSGTATVTADGQVSGELVIDAASVDSGMAKRDKHLRTKDFFEVEKYPTFVYSVTGGRPAADGTVELAGSLTVHGVSRPLDLSATVTSTGPNSATVSGEADIDRSEWGLSWTKMGARVDNHIVISAAFTK
jgi:polyisoprenoid-binding protein YceI